MSSIWIPIKDFVKRTECLAHDLSNIGVHMPPKDIFKHLLPAIVAQKCDEPVIEVDETLYRELCANLLSKAKIH